MLAYQNVHFAPKKQFASFLINFSWLCGSKNTTIRRISATLLIMITGLMCGSTVHAQNCWTGIPSWTVGFGVSGTGSGSCQGGECTVEESAAASNLNLNIPVTSCAKEVATWAGISGSNATGNVNDIVKIGLCNITFSGIDTITEASALLTVNLPETVYLFGGWVGGAGKVDDSCYGSNPTSSAAGTQTQPSFPLPTDVGQLSATSYEFHAPDILLQVNTGWALSFTATPNYNPDDDCQHNSNEGDPASSSIGCQSQSLGEDIPVAGTGFHLHYESGRTPGAAGDSVANSDAAMIGGWTLSVHHAYNPGTNTLFLGDGTQRNGYQLGKPVSYKGNLLLASEDGTEVYAFSTTTGQHLQTLKPLTGALEYQFGYDAVGKLVTIKDASGNVTTIQRNAAEEPTTIVSPYGQITTLTVSASGSLSQVTDPLGKSEKLVTTVSGLLTSRTDANGNVFHYTYDGNGRLIKDADPLGGYIAAVRHNAPSGFEWTVGETTSMGRTNSYQSAIAMPWIQNLETASYSEQRTNIWPDGLNATSSKQLENGQITESFDLPDGTSDSATSGPDPVWGLQVPVTTVETLTQGSLKMNVTGNRSAALGIAGNPFSVTTRTDTQTINNRTYTSTYTESNHSYLRRSPVGRTLTVGLDSLERVGTTQTGELAMAEFTYDGRGRLASATQGTRKTVFSYNPQGFLASVTDPLQLTTSFTYDANGRLSATKLPDGRIVGYAYDANGNLTSITPPGKPAHKFTYNAVDLQSSYTPPTDDGAGATTYTYNLDRDLTAIVRPDGEKIEYGYDAAGRLNSTATPTETVEYSYDPATGNVSSAFIQSGEALDYGYNGSLLTSSRLTGKVAGSVSRAFDDNFWVTSESINSGNTVEFTYDKDGLVTNAGPLVITRDAKDGLISETTLGNVIEGRTHDEFGELTGKTATYKTDMLYNVTYTRDANGRVSAKTETVGGQKNTYTYGYDKAGRLIQVTKNGSHHSSYTYDTNSNRVTVATPSGIVSGTYDDQDRLLIYGNASFTYTANGELESQTVGGQKTTYTYDALGNLIAVALPSGTKISYIVDPENHRVGKEVNGVLETGFLYDGGRIIAQLSGSNQILSRFVYGTGTTSPDYMVRGGANYRIFSDQLGSPILVMNTLTGAIAEQISYDEFGNVLSDTNPGFQPFGFAGGLYDQQTKLVRFGARDYNPAIGRWTAKDPILFKGGDTNLYAYVLQNPTNFIDPSGRDIVDVLSYVAIPVHDWIVDKVDWITKKCKCNQKEPENEELTIEQGGGTTATELVIEQGTHLAVEGAGEYAGEQAETEVVGKVAPVVMTIGSGSESFARELTIFKQHFDYLNQKQKEADQCEKQ